SVRGGWASAWNANPHERAGTDVGVDTEIAAHLPCAFFHSDKSQRGVSLKTFTLSRNVKPMSVVLNPYVEVAADAVQRNPHIGRSRVTNRIGDGLLNDTKNSKLVFGRQKTFVKRHVDLHVHPFQSPGLVR